MSFQKLETNSFCVGQKHYSPTKNIVGKMTFSKKTVKEIELLVGQCSLCSWKESVILSDNTMVAESPGDFFKNLGKERLDELKKMAKRVVENPSRFLGISANVATTAASRNPKNLLSTFPEMINFYHSGKGLYLGKFVWFHVK